MTTTQDPPGGAPAAQDPPADPGRADDTGARLDRLETTVNGLAAAIREGGSAQEGAEKLESERLGGPASIADQVRRQLDDRDRQAEATEHAKRLDELAATVKEMAENPPADPPKRRHRFMGWA